jgi:hypothetical protein
MKLQAPLAALTVALGVIFTAAPASAQYAQQSSAQYTEQTPQAAEQVPWYMPQPWVHPPQTGPKIRKPPGYYGHRYRNRSYGGFSSYCYGDCGYRAPGTISTGGGVTLKRPTVVAFDPNDYIVVPRTLFEPPQPATYQRRAAPVTPVVVPTNQQRGYKPKPKVTMQNGVRVIQLTPLTTSNY